MKALAGAIQSLRDAVSAAAPADVAAVEEAIDAAAFTDPAIAAIPGERSIRHVSVTPIEPTTVEELERILGPARRLPRNPSGGSLTFMFGDTLPREGESGATVLAEADEDGRISRLIVRADTF